MAAAIGNQYAAKSKRWQMAIERALEKRSRADQVEALDELATKFLELCDQGDLAAFKELGDRLDGKSAQALTVGNPEGEEFKTAQRIELVALSDNSTS